MKKILLFLGVVIVLLIIAVIISFFYFKKDIWREKETVDYLVPSQTSFPFQAIDTMKNSRDLSREKLEDESFNLIIDKQVADIAALGVTHIAIATPYDEEFLPFLKRWVAAARKHNVKVWFRGNWSGWEGWFDYPKISRREHMRKTIRFILSNSDIFEDGDAFSSCPECENGGSGDPRQTGDVESYRKFLIDEYELMNLSFDKINKKVKTNLFSMNGDVAELVMDRNTTKALGGVVTIDHYVDTPEKLIKDINYLSKKSGGKIILGEFGVPIPDIHGEMSEDQQAQWIEKMLSGLQSNTSLVGVSYWLNKGGSTALWGGDGSAKPATGIIKKYYSLNVVYGSIYDELNKPMKNIKVQYADKKTTTDKNGYYELKFPEKDEKKRVIFSAPGYLTEEAVLKKEVSRIDVTLIKKNKNFIDKSILQTRDWSENKSWTEIFKKF